MNTINSGNLSFTGSSLGHNSQTSLEANAVTNINTTNPQTKQVQSVHGNNRAKQVDYHNTSLIGSRLDVIA